MQQLLNAPVEVSTNSILSTLSDAGFVGVTGTQKPGDEKEIRSDSFVFQETGHRFFIKPEDFVWLEISLVPEVEAVFVQREHREFNIVVVVDSRDEGLRDRIYDREAAIIDAQTRFDFNFRILTRMGRPESELNVPTVAAYRRR